MRMGCGHSIGDKRCDWCPLSHLCIVLTAVIGLMGCEGKQDVYDRPIANCLEVRDLVRNRPYPPPHGVHSYAKDVPICEKGPR